MSDPVTALGGAQFTGRATVTEAPLSGMITLRGDLSAAQVTEAVKSVTGMAVPAPRKITHQGAYHIAWMSPDEVLILCAYADVTDTVEQLQAALGDSFAMVVDVSDARAMFVLSGDAAAVLAKLAPVDVTAAAFPPGSFRRTRLAQVAAAFWRAENDTLHIVCFRSVAQYVFDLLKNAAQPE